jgi:hypothetical protein
MTDEEILKGLGHGSLQQSTANTMFHARKRLVELLALEKKLSDAGCSGCVEFFLTTLPLTGVRYNGGEGWCDVCGKWVKISITEGPEE